MMTVNIVLTVLILAVNIWVVIEVSHMDQETYRAKLVMSGIVGAVLGALIALTWMVP